MRGSPNHRSSIGRDDKTKINSKTSSVVAPKANGVAAISTTKSLPSIRLPSLSEDALLMAKPSFQSFNSSFSSNDFALSVPVFRRTRFDLFGMDDFSFDKNFLRTQMDGTIRSENNALDSKLALSSVMDEVGGQRGSPLLDGSNRNLAASKLKKDKSKVNSGAYTIKSSKHRSHMKSDDERKKKLDHAIKKKQDKKDIGFHVLAGGDKSAHSLNFSGHHNLRENLSRGNEGGLKSPALIKNALMESELDTLNSNYDKYFGEKAFEDFHNKFLQSKRQLELFEDHEIPRNQLTPRYMYLREVEKMQGIPLPLVLRKESNPLGLFFGHKGLGDRQVYPIVRVIDKLPAVTTIDLCDNRLTDLTLMPLAFKLRKMTSLTYLDLSFNKMDESSTTIMDYLISDTCNLGTLLLNGADVDDGECVKLANAIAKNQSVHTLGLAKNLIGKSEMMNTVDPNITTGAEALGETLRVNKTLKVLDLGWNFIRLSSAVALAMSLEVNHTLTTLLLGYNSFGDMPSQILGKVLKDNKGLTELDIEANSLTPKAATVLANSISFNDTLLKLNINGNVLGKMGAQALVAAIQRSSTEVRKMQVTFINCDCTKNDINIFSAANPHGTWRLNLAEPYGQMVATECMYLANYKAGCRIVKLFHNGSLITLERAFLVDTKESPDSSAVQKKKQLDEFMKNQRMAAKDLLESNMAGASRNLHMLLEPFKFRMTEEQQIQVLQKTKDLWNLKAKREGREDFDEVFLFEFFFALFIINDADFSGTMDLDEFIETLSSLGRPKFDQEAAKRFMSEYDKDESGSIDANEFAQIMLKEFFITDIPRGDLVDSSTGQPWVIPPKGNCVIQLSYQCDAPTVFDIGEDFGIDNIIQSIRDASTDEQREILFNNTTSSPYFFLSFEQAQLLFEEMQGLNHLPLDLMASILPQIVNDDNALRFIETNLNDSGKLALRIKIGQLFNSYVGLHSGHYTIDLKKVEQKNGARRLGAISVSEGKVCRQANANTSQKGNYSNFRNEKLGYAPVELNGRWFASTTSQAVLRFDYVSTNKPRKGTPCLVEKRFEKLVSSLNLEQLKAVWDRMCYNKEVFMEEQQREYEASLPDDATAMSDGSELEPNNQSRPLSRRGTNSSSLSSHSSQISLPTFPPYVINPADYPEIAVEAPITMSLCKDAYSDFMDSCHHYYDIYPEERMRDVSRPGYNPNERPATPEGMKLAPPPNRSVMHPIFPMAYRKILELQIMAPHSYFSINQLFELISYFPSDSNAGYLRLQVIISLFSHIVDLEHMYLIFDNVLTFDERNELFHRVGIMNVLDPMRPERLYRLDLRRNDHREWAKILVYLATNDPGGIWEEVEYRWGKFDEPVPGWTLPSTWTRADDGGVNGGPRNFGWLQVRYRSQTRTLALGARKLMRKRTLAGMKRAVL